jgi:hypothetical protein
VTEYQGAAPAANTILWESSGSTKFGDVIIDRYLLHHSRYLTMPLLWIHRTGTRPTLLWLGDGGKATAQDWPQLKQQLDSGYNIITFDPRGLGETRMPYKAVSEDDPSLAQLDYDHAYVNPISGVLADYVYNSILTGRPYLLQMIEDAEIASRFAQAELKTGPGLFITGNGNGYSLASAIAETLPNTNLLANPGAKSLKWSEIVEEKRELWPVDFLLPGGAYIH